MFVTRKKKQFISIFIDSNENMQNNFFFIDNVCFSLVHVFMMIKFHNDEENQLHQFFFILFVRFILGK